MVFFADGETAGVSWFFWRDGSVMVFCCERGQVAYLQIIFLPVFDFLKLNLNHIESQIHLPFLLEVSQQLAFPKYTR